MGENKWADVVGVVELAMNTDVAASMVKLWINSISDSYPACQSISQSNVRHLINQLP